MPRVAEQKKERSPAQIAAAKAAGERLAAARRRVAPVASSKIIEPMEMNAGDDIPRVLKSTGPAKDALEPAVIVAKEVPIDPEKQAMIQFMEEMVTVHVHTTTDPQAEQIFEIFNNGRREVFRRGETKTVKRYFVDGLARSKPTTFTQKEDRSSSGEKQYLQIPSTGLRYPFSVVRDDNPKGADWLRWAMNAGA